MTDPRAGVEGQDDYDVIGDVSADEDRMSAPGKAGAIQPVEVRPK